MQCIPHSSFCSRFYLTCWHGIFHANASILDFVCQILKFYAWEASFEAQVQGIRENELKVMRNFAYLSSVSTFLFSCAPAIVSKLMFEIIKSYNLIRFVKVIFVWKVINAEYILIFVHKYNMYLSMTLFCFCLLMLWQYRTVMPVKNLLWKIRARDRKAIGAPPQFLETEWEWIDFLLLVTSMGNQHGKPDRKWSPLRGEGPTSCPVVGVLQLTSNPVQKFGQNATIHNENVTVFILISNLTSEFWNRGSWITR